ncbi:carboxypeptidase Q-like isoform X2 [Varroa destructor]|uniref:Carboxypeptidase Q n=1 Tax=Varroa destructor TaxID=109461 RepID=A0A7M7KI95_VARDE|nr:carboxypeptidase Q-like isoform X2 [Varroa destructor]
MSGDLSDSKKDTYLPTYLPTYPYCLEETRLNSYAFIMKFAFATTCLGLVSTVTGLILTYHQTDAHLHDKTLCEGKLDPSIVKEIRSYQADVDKIINHILTTEKGETWRQLAAFVDKHGPRFTGTTDLENAIDDRVKYFTDVVQLGPSQVHTEYVEVPRWNRGETEAVLLNAWEGGRNKTLGLLSLGYSVGTPSANGLTAEAIVVRSFDEMHAKPDSEIQGKIVVYNQPYVNYETTVKYRLMGASQAASKGAIAAIVRSVTGHSLYTPHTGMMTYDSKFPKIPGVCITAEEADLMWRKQQRGEKLRVFLRSTAHLDEKTVTSRNTIADLRGTEKPNEFVVISGHIDSWDVGQGAMDDGGGAAITWRTLQVLRTLGLAPRRTIRSVLFTAEEVGILGGEAYFAKHKKSAADVQYIMESDYGTFTPLGLTTAVKNDQARCVLQEALSMLKSINATALLISNSGPDIKQWFDIGVPGGSLYNNNPRYFDYHHTNADTPLLMLPDDMDRATAVWASMSYVLAQISVRMDHDAPSDPVQ